MAKRNAIQMDKVQRGNSIFWNAFAELKNSDGTAITPFKSRRIKDGVCLWYQAIRAIIINFRNTHSEGAVAH
jgi:hypothetical protein